MRFLLSHFSLSAALEEMQFATSIGDLTSSFEPLNEPQSARRAKAGDLTIARLPARKGAGVGISTDVAD